MSGSWEPFSTLSMVREAAHCDPVPLGVGEELQQPGGIVGRRRNLKHPFSLTGAISPNRQVVKHTSVENRGFVSAGNHQSTKRLQRHVGSLLSGGSLLFALANLF